MAYTVSPVDEGTRERYKEQDPLVQADHERQSGGFLPKLYQGDQQPPSSTIDHAKPDQKLLLRIAKRIITIFDCIQLAVHLGVGAKFVTRVQKVTREPNAVAFEVLNKWSKGEHATSQALYDCLAVQDFGNIARTVKDELVSSRDQQSPSSMTDHAKPDQKFLLRIAEHINTSFDCAKLAVHLGVGAEFVTRVQEKTREPNAVAFEVLNKWSKEEHATSQALYDCLTVQDFENIARLVKEQSEMRSRQLQSTNEGFHAFIAVDFGSMYSSLAYAIGSGSSEICFPDFSHPTAVLLDKYGKLLAFGEQALAEYFDLESEDRMNYYLFDRFTMILKNEKVSMATTKITAVNGKTMDAKTVFARSLQYFYETVKVDIPRSTGVSWAQEEAKWILTVPAIWGDYVTRFLLDAAEEAGMMRNHRDNVEIVLEAEAAAFSCRDDLQEIFKLMKKDKFRFIVADCGKETVDVTVHELDLVMTKIHEVHKPTEGPWGGAEVDKNLTKVLEKAIGSNLVSKIDTNSWLRFSRQSIKEGRKLPKDGGKATIQITHDLLQAIASAGGNLASSGSKIPGVTFRKKTSVFQVDYDIMASCYAEPIRNTVKHVRHLKDDIGDIHCILVVGGFAECPLLMQEIEKEFKADKCKVICPNYPSLSVVKGAVMYGQNPNIIQTRVAKYSYGIAASTEFQPGVHPDSHCFTEGGADYCRNVFAHFVHAGDSMRIGNAYKHVISPTAANQEGMSLQLYRSQNKDVKFTDEPGCERLSVLRVKMPRVELGMDRVVEVSLNLGRTTLHLIAIDKSSGQHDDDVCRYLN